MSINELLERKADVDRAIAKVLKGGQVIQTPNGKVQLASLNELRAERAVLEQQIAEAQRLSHGGDSFGTPCAYYGRG